MEKVTRADNLQRPQYRALGRNVFLKNVAESSRLFQMAFFVVAARRFGPIVLGDITFLLMLGSVVALVFGDLGVNTTVIARMNATSETSSERLASVGLFCKILLTVLSFVLMIGSMGVTGRFGNWQELLAVSVISCGSIWHEFLAALTNGVNRLDVEARFRIIYRAAVYGVGSLLCLWASLNLVLSYMAESAVLILAGTFLVLRARVIRLKVLPHLAMAASLLRHSIPVWITQVAQLTYLKLDVVVLGILHVTARDIGWYSAGWKIVDVITTAPALLAGAALPLISGALPGSNVRSIVPGYLKAMYVFPYFVVLPIAIGAPYLTRLLYGGLYAGTGAVLSVLVWALVPISIHSFLAYVSVAIRRQTEVAKIGSAAAVIGLAAAAFAIPVFGYQAMAMISLIVNSAFALVLVFRFRDVTSSTYLSIFLKSSAVALFIYGASFLVSSVIPSPITALSGTVAYAVALLALGIVTVRDVGRGCQILGSLLSRRSADSVSPA